MCVRYCKEAETQKHLIKFSIDWAKKRSQSELIGNNSSSNKLEVICTHNNPISPPASFFSLFLLLSFSLLCQKCHTLIKTSNTTPILLLLNKVATTSSSNIISNKATIPLLPNRADTINLGKYTITIIIITMMLTL